MPDVDSHHVFRAAPEQDLREAAGGGAGVQAALSLRDDLRESVQRPGQFVAGPADVGVLPVVGDVQGCEVVHLGGGFRENGAVRADFAFGNQPRGMGAGSRQSPGDEHLVKPGHPQASPAADGSSSFRASSSASWSAE